MQHWELTEFVPLAFAWSDVSNCSIRPTLYLHKEQSKRQVNYNLSKVAKQTFKWVLNSTKSHPNYKQLARLNKCWSKIHSLSLSLSLHGKIGRCNSCRTQKRSSKRLSFQQICWSLHYQSFLTEIFSKWTAIY